MKVKINKLPEGYKVKNGQIVKEFVDEIDRDKMWI